MLCAASTVSVSACLNRAEHRNVKLYAMLSSHLGILGTMSDSCSSEQELQLSQPNQPSHSF